MRVRDHTKKVSEYKGRWTEAYDRECPCRPCYNAHNCQRDPAKHWDVPDMRCATRDNSGCPRPDREPVHDFNRAGYCRRCRIHKRRLEAGDAAVQ